jgi:hypothetical protein
MISIMVVFLGEGARRRGGAQCRNEHYATPQSPLCTPRRLLSDLFRNGKLDADVLDLLEEFGILVGHGYKEFCLYRLIRF